MYDEQYVSGVNFGLDASVKVHRTAILVGNGIRVGRLSRIDAYTVITGKVTLGERCHIGHGAGIFGTNGVVIGKVCSLSPGAKIFTDTDDIHGDLLANPQAVKRGGKSGAVCVGDFSVIGANAVVLPNSIIGDEVQVGANAVVRLSIPDNNVWVGNPAHFLCMRKHLNRGAMTHEPAILSR